MLLADLQKAFEPYCTLWKRVDDWTGWHKSWMNGSFLSLDAEEVSTGKIKAGRRVAWPRKLNQHHGYDI